MSRMHAILSSLTVTTPSSNGRTLPSRLDNGNKRTIFSSSSHSHHLLLIWTIGPVPRRQHLVDEGWSVSLVAALVSPQGHCRPPTPGPKNLGDSFRWRLKASEIC